MSTDKQGISRRAVLGAAALGTAVQTGCWPFWRNEFFVVCHGMMLFEFVKGNSEKYSWLVLHLPFVPATPLKTGSATPVTDPGHVYKAGSWSQQGPPDLEGGTPYHLTGPIGNVAPPAQIKDSENVLVNPACTMTGGDLPFVKIYMPVPDEYRRWRYVDLERGGYSVPCDGRRGNMCMLPNQLYGTHIFVYRRPGIPVLLRDGASVPFWRQTDKKDNALHIYAEPCKPSDSTQAMPDHSDYLHRLFNPQLTLSIKMKDNSYGEGPLPSGFSDCKYLLGLGETSCGKSQDLTAQNRDGIHLTNCRSYFQLT